MENESGPKKRFERRPNFDMHAKLSRDGKYWIIERIEAWILPRKYLDVIAENHQAMQPTNPIIPGTLVERVQKKGKRNADSNG